MRLEALPNPADADYPYNPEAAAWLANYYNRWEYNYGGIPGYGGGGGGGGVNTVTGFWDRNASTAGMLGFRYENGQYIDNATSNTVPYSVVYNNYITPHSNESYSFRDGNNIEWGYWAGVVSKPNMFLTLVLTDGTKLKFDFKNELRDISNTVNTPIRNYAVADITEQICAGALNFALGLFFGGITEIGVIGSSISSANSGAEIFFEGARYSPKVLRQMLKADDFVHSFPISVDGFATKFGQWSTQIGADGRAYQWLEMGGSYGGKTGTFEFIKDANGVINHRFLNILKTPK